jgi:hypothetical protein
MARRLRDTDDRDCGVASAVMLGEMTDADFAAMLGE